MTNLHDISASAGQLPTYIINGRCTASNCTGDFAHSHHRCYKRDGIEVYYCIDTRHQAAKYYFNRENPDGSRDMSQYCPEHRGNPR